MALPGRSIAAPGASAFASGLHPRDRPQPEGKPFLLSEDPRAFLDIPDGLLRVRASKVVAMIFRDRVRRRQRHLGREGRLVGEVVSRSART